MISKSIIIIPKKILSIILNFKSFNLIIFILQFSNVILQDCPKEFPFRKNGSCTNICEEAIYNSTNCKINNSIIKNQFPNDIIFVGHKTLRYTNFITFSNGDMLFHTSSFPQNTIKIFYGLKSNGRPYFRDSNNKETPFWYNETIVRKRKYESGNSIFVKDGKEYLISFGRRQSYSEFYDIENQRIISNYSLDLIFDNYNFRTNCIPVGENSYILSGLKSINNSLYRNIIKFNLYLEGWNKLYSNITKEEIKPAGIGTDNIGSCFRIENKEIIICFYPIINTTVNYSITAYSLELEELYEEIYVLQGKINSYCYSIFFRENAGAFIYYKNNKHHPVIFFEKYDNNSFDNYFSDISEIILDKFNSYNTNYLNNYIMKK